MTAVLKTGEILHKRYKIKRIIGQGGAGSIYLADDLRLSGRQCALKEVEHDRSLPADLINEAREQFLREATVLARLDHPNLPKVSDFFTMSNRDYLSYLHGQNPSIIHRDIKPSNLKLTPSGILKLVDFGLVKVLAPDDVTITILQGQGTAVYTPLEQLGGSAIHTDGRSDIFSFGATLYHLLTNHPPAEARERFLDPSLYISPREINPAISSKVEHAIEWGMALHPSERPADIQTFKQALLGNATRSSVAIRAKNHPLRDYFRLPVERALLLAGIGLLLISFFVSVFR
jgi:serine/threonine-protein kinase